ncbi:MAG: Ig-like domain-containing protein [Flavobacteriales bacterium]|nr:Ig-like domain-containing protein [Flavobacteriales bacterium]
MSKRVYMRGWPTVILLTIIWGCAQVRQVSGGAKDTTPPQLVETDPPNYSTGFASDRIELKFDEYVQLNNVAQELIISPTPAKKPTIQLRDRMVRVLLKEPLDSNTTYTFNFGKSIVDLNESNPASDLVYVCATGDALDSLEIRGIVKDAWTDAPIDGIKIMLFDTTDTLPHLSAKPRYFTRTKSDGSFLISYLKEHTYRLLALGDENDTFTLEENERFSISPSSLVPSDRSDSMQLLLPALSAYHPPLSRIPDVISDSAGTITMKWPSGNALPQISAIDATHQAHLRYDSLPGELHIWITGPVTDRMEGLAFSHPLAGSDTLSVPVYSESLEQLPQPVLYASPKRKPGQPWEFTASQWLVPAASPQCSFKTGGNMVNVPVVPHTTKANVWTALYEPPAGSDTDWIIPAGTFTNLASQSNDTTTISCYTYALEDLGLLRLNFSGLEKAQHPIVVYNRKNEPPVAITAAASLVLSNLEAGEYELRIIDDINHNGKWDTADPNGRQAEKVWVHPATTIVKANWEVVVNWVLP